MAQDEQLMKKISYFLLYTFAITWIAWSAIILANRYFDVLWYGTPLFWIPMLIGGLGPAFGVYIIFRQFNEDFRERSFKSFVFKKIDKRAWFIFSVYTVWRFIMIWISFGIQDPISILYMFMNLPLFIIGGGFEELGWRGYLQPKLEKMTGYLASIFIVGIIWSLWHLPLWLVEGSVQSAIPFGAYTFVTIVLSASLTTIYKYTKNLFLCVLTHAWFNGCIGLAVYIGNDGYLQLNLNWRVVAVFILELIISLILGRIYSKKCEEESN